MRWELCDERGELHELRHLLDQLELLFARERRAIGRLDGDEILAVTDAKGAIADRLQLLAEATLRVEAEDGSPLCRIEDPEVRRLREHVRSAAETMVAEARASAALLTDAVESVGSALGANDGANTYDRRARRSQTLRGVIAKAV